MERREAEAVIDRVRSVPEQFRTFTVAAGDVLSLYGMDAESVALLIEFGLPHRSTGGLQTFDPRDLANVALHLGFPSVQRRAFDAAVRSLAVADATTPIHAVVDCMPVGLAGPPAEELTFRLPGTRRLTVPYRAGRPAVRLVKLLTGRVPALPPEVGEALGYVAALEFWLLPEGLRHDTSFARSSGLSDCVVSARLVHERCRDLGVRARRRFGLLLSQPFSMKHSWAEVWSGEGWVAVDPLLLGALAWHAGLDAARWPVARSLNCLLMGLGASPRELAACGASPVRVSLPTRFTPSLEQVGAGGTTPVWIAPAHSRSPEEGAVR